MRTRCATLLVVAAACAGAACAREGGARAEKASAGAGAASAGAAPGTAAPAAAATESANTEAPALAGPHRTVYDFAANDPAAVHYRNGALFVRCGTLDFLKYSFGGFHANWYVLRKWDDRPVAFVAGTGASIRVPLDADVGGPGLQNLELIAGLRPVVAKQRVSVFFNEKPAGTVDLPETGFQALRLPLSGAHAGENKLRFQFRAAGNAPPGRSAAAFDLIQIAPAAPPPPDPRVSYYLWIPPGTKLVADGDPTVRAAVDGAPAREILRQGESVADLAPIAGRFARLDFLGGPRDMRVVAPGEEPAPPKLAAKNVVIWMIDTLRPDHVGAYEPGTPVKTPNLDDFARRGVLFRNATVQGNWSLTSHASILTGVYPARHRGYDEKDRLAESLEFAGEILRKHGFFSATFLSNGYVSEKWGFNQGWDYYTNFVRDAKPSHAEWLWTHARDWLGKRKAGDRRTFLYLATIDPHVIYNPPKPYVAMYHPEPYAGIVKPVMTGLLLGKIKAGAKTLGERDKRFLHALYMGEITYNDEWFGRMRKDLAALGLSDSVIAVVSDHGDEFYEHGSVGHGHSVYQELVATPLMIGGAGLPAGRVVDVDVEAMDLLPTLLDLAGLPPAEGVHGESLVPLIFGDGPRAARPAFSTQGGALFGMKLATAKLVTAGPERTELYDLAADPMEQKNVIAERPIAARAAVTAFALWYPFADEWQKSEWGVSSNLAPAFVKEKEP